MHPFCLASYYDFESGIDHQPCTTTGAYGKASVSPSVFAPYQAYFNASLAKVINCSRHPPSCSWVDGCPSSGGGKRPAVWTASGRRPHCLGCQRPEIRTLLPISGSSSPMMQANASGTIQSCTPAAPSPIPWRHQPLQTAVPPFSPPLNHMCRPTPAGRSSPVAAPPSPCVAPTTTSCPAASRPPMYVT